MADRILIIGLGSAGQRHARNAYDLGCVPIGYDTNPFVDPSRLGHASICVASSIADGLKSKPIGVVVATPPATHYAIGMQLLDSRLPVLMEKPLAESAQEAEDLAKRYEWQAGAPLMVGYQFRHTASLRQLKRRVEMGIIHTTQAQFSSQRWCSGTYNADFLLECSHELDLVRHFLGDPCRAITIKLGPYQYNVLIDFDSRAAFVMLDGTHDGYNRHLLLYGSYSLGEWSFDLAENDQAYKDELAEFLRVCRGEQATPSCTGRDGWWALRMVEAIRRSDETGRWEAI